jgi:capsular exopolysaccharide synthesis family protein
MSKIYEAILKVEREQAVDSEISVPSEPEPEEEASFRNEATEAERLLTDAPSIIPPKGPMPKTKGPVERFASHISVGRFLARPNSISEEQFRKLKSAITTHHLARSLRSVLVSSCMPGEGRTTVALNLSAIIAKGPDDCAILIDADLRRQGLTSLLGLRNAPGLSDILEERASVDEVIVETEIDGLDILPGGFNPGNPSELLGSRRMRNAVEQLKQRRGSPYIIIDSTPMISTAEVNALSQMVDGIVVVIMADKTRRDLVKRELQAIKVDKPLGVVLNRAQFETSDYSDSYHKHDDSYER